MYCFCAGGYQACVTAARHINSIFPRKRDLGTPKALSREMPENSGKFPGFLLKKKERNVKKQAAPGNSGKFIVGIPNWHFGMIFLGG